MQQFIAQVSLVVSDYDEAILFFTGKLKFELLEDTFISEQNKRWVRIAPPGSPQTSILLAKASSESQRQAIGNQSGGRVFLFLHTDDFARDYEDMRTRGVTFVRAPRTESYGTVAVFEDLYGNLWDLIQPVDGSCFA